MVTASSDFMVLVDATYTYRAVNQAYCDAHQRTQEEILGHTVAEVFGEEPFSATLKPHLDRCLSGEPVKFSFWWDSPSGGRRHIDATYDPFFEGDGSVSAVVVDARDSTERKRVEEQLEGSVTKLEAANQQLQLEMTERKAAQQAFRESEGRFRAVIQAAADAIVGADSDGGITFFNPAAEATFGYRSDDVLGKPLWHLMPERYRDAHQKGLERYRSTGEAHVMGKTVELWGRRQDGTEFPLELSLSTWETTEGSFYTGIIRDITERKEAEEQLENSVAALEVANRELEAFSDSLAHDLRSPLLIVTNFSHQLRETLGDYLGEQQADDIQRIQNAGRHMMHIIDDLRDLGDVNRVEISREEVDLTAMGQDIINGLEALVPDRDVLFEAEPEINADGDRTLLRILLTNLLQNAWKYTGPVEKPWIELGVDDTGNDVPIYHVRDNGIGFDNEKSELIFHAFERLHTRTEFAGSGLGLATVVRVVRRHGGLVWGEGVPGEGAVFRFTLGSSSTDPLTAEDPT